MARRPLTILPLKEEEWRRNQNIDDPRIRRHDGAVYAINYVLQRMCIRPEHHQMSGCPPQMMHQICHHLNRNYLTRKDDMRLVALGLWRIILRLPIHQNSTEESPSHLGLYFEERFPFPNGKNKSYLIRRKSNQQKFLEKNPERIKSITTITTTDGSDLMYCAKNLHCTEHGSFPLKDLPQMLDKTTMLRIPHSHLSPESAGSLETVSGNGVYVAFPGSPIFKKLDKMMLHGTATVKFRLTSYLVISSKKSDARRMHGFISSTEGPFHCRCQFGYGRIQKETWWYCDKKMPTLNVESFLTMPTNLQSLLMMVLEVGTMFAKRGTPESFGNGVRSEVFARKMNAQLGFPLSQNRFEFVDIVVSRNTVLAKHLDFKNDHRKDYNQCVVYSFHQMVAEIEYKVSMIMTSRTTVGADLDSITV